MSVSIQVIRELHAWYLNLEDIQLQFDRGSKQILAYQQQDQDTRIALDKAQQDHNQLRLEGEQKELDLQISEKKIEDFKGRLNQVKTNREYQVICDQIETEKKSNSNLEDEILEAYSRIDEHSKHVVNLEDEVNSVQKELDARKRSVETDSRRLEERSVEVKQWVKDAEAVLPSNAKETYHRLVGARGSDGMALVENGICNGCFTNITPQMQNELLLSQQLVLCKSCGRLLYLSE